MVYCFTQLGFFADVYLDYFYEADTPAPAPSAFQSLQDLLDELGLQSSPDKDYPPSTHMICIGIEVDSDNLTLSVPLSRVQELLDELKHWSSPTTYTKEQLQSLPGKLSFVTACMKPGRVFMSRLLHNLRSFPSHRVRHPVSHHMKADIAWWLSFLPVFNGFSLIKGTQSAMGQH